MINQDNLKSQRDRITSLLTQNARPFGQEVADISNAYLSSLSSGTGASGFNQSYQNLQQSRRQEEAGSLQNQMQLYNLMQDELKQGNEDAFAVDKAIKDVVGNDVNAYEKIASQLHKLPDQVNRQNASQLVSKIASNLKYKPLGQTADELDIQYKKAQLNKLNADSRKLNLISQNNVQNIDPILARNVDKDAILKSRETAEIANSSLKSLDQIENSLFNKEGQPKFTTGKSQAFKEKIGQYVPLVDSSNYQNVLSKSTKLGLDISSMLKGQTSDRDVSRSLETVPGYDKDPKANKRIIKDQKAALKVVSEMPKFVSQWRSKYGSTIATDEQGKTFDEAYLDWQGQRFKELGGQKETQEIKQSSEQEEAIAELKRRGLM